MTGANRGIGLACARSLRSQGFAVAAASRSGAVSDADDFSNVTCDVRSTSQVEAAAREVEVAFGSLDVVVANAGISALAKTQRITDQALAQVIDKTPRAIPPKMTTVLAGGSATAAPATAPPAPASASAPAGPQRTARASCGRRRPAGSRASGSPRARPPGHR